MDADRNKYSFMQAQPSLVTHLTIPFNRGKFAVIKYYALNIYCGILSRRNTIAELFSVKNVLGNTLSYKIVRSCYVDFIFLLYLYIHCGATSLHILSRF